MSCADDLAVARADLAAANARCADARCVCGCTWDNHEDAGVRCTSHESCLGFRADRGEGWASYAAEQERNAALQATLDRVTALADEWNNSNDSRWIHAEELLAALTPEGKDRADRVDAEDGGRR